MSVLMRRICLAVAVLVGVAGCGAKTPTRDFNELIPRMMGAVNRNSNPVDAAANLFNVTSPDERRDAIAYLETKKYGHEPAYMRAYEILTTDPHPMVRAQAMRALGGSHDAAAVPYLINGTTGKTGLADPEAEVRRDAAQGLLKVLSPEAFGPLMDHLAKDTDDQVRVACARALRHARNAEGARALIQALDDKNAAVVYWAHESLIMSTGMKLSYDGKEWMEWWQETYGKKG